MTKARVLKQIYAGTRIWELGDYPTPSIHDISALIRVAEYQESENIPTKERSVVLLGEDSKVKSITKEIVEDEVVEEELEVTSDEEEETYLSKDEFDELKAQEQKSYLKEILNDYEEKVITDEELYSVLSEYQQVATAPSVKTIINDELAKWD